MMLQHGKQKLRATLSIDLDNQWAYMKTRGDEKWSRLPSYLHLFIPRFLELLAQLNLKITFFIVGQDAVLPAHQELMARITAEGHEVGNHSFSHEPSFLSYEKSRIREEVLAAGEAIESATGVKPMGFRGPGFSWSRELFEVLRECDYGYDASTFPTYLGPLARAYYFATSGVSAVQKARLRHLYGSFRDGRRPLWPYRWHLRHGHDLLELPVTTIPIFRLPFHMTYLCYLGSYSQALMRLYLKSAIHLCRLTGQEPHFLLHPLDLMGADLVPDLSYFPSMNIASEQKGRMVIDTLRTLGSAFEVCGMNEYARALVGSGHLAVTEA